MSHIRPLDSFHFLMAPRGHSALFRPAVYTVPSKELSSRKCSKPSDLFVIYIINHCGCRLNPVFDVYRVSDTWPNLCKRIKILTLSASPDLTFIQGAYWGSRDQPRNSSTSIGPTCRTRSTRHMSTGWPAQIRMCMSTLRPGDPSTINRSLLL